MNQSQENQSEIASKIKRFEPKYVTLVLAVFPLIVLGGALLFQLTWAESFTEAWFLIAASLVH